MRNMKKIVSLILAGSLLLSLAACAGAKSAELESELNLTAEPKEASTYTAEINSAVYSQLDFADTEEAENALRGLIDAPETLELVREDGTVIWSQDAYGFLEDYEEAPATVNPSLWENAKNNHAYGLFEVVDGIYQVRGYDMSNLTLIEGETGWIVLDTLMSAECTEAAMDLVEKNLGSRPVKAVIISHNHADHFGGIRGLMAEEEAADRTLSLEDQLQSGGIPIIVPEGFTKHAVAENLYAGAAMGRRAGYQYGTLLEPGTDGRLSIGIGMGQSLGTSGFILPTCEIVSTGQKITIDGIEMEFQLTPGTEAAAEMNLWFPQFKALWMAENCTASLHNLYTLRGAEVRDGAAWAKYIGQAIALYGADAEVVFQSHNWPHWGNETICTYMKETAAVYQFINDQTLTWINQGYTADEISNMIKLPAALEKNWYCRQYYGTVAHNSQAVYQKYMGWYDANPVHLNPLPPSESAEKWVEYLGDTDKVLRMAKEDFEKGQYQWVAEITNVLVYADPQNTAARLLCADALEQLGYQAESGPWRNAYLSAALELRSGNQASAGTEALRDGTLQKQMSAEMIFGYMGILLDMQAMEEQNFTMNVTLIDTKQQLLAEVVSGVVLVTENAASADPDISITCPKNALLLMLQRNYDGFSQFASVEGDEELLKTFITNLNQFAAGSERFNIIEP